MKKEPGPCEYLGKKRQEIGLPIPYCKRKEGFPCYNYNPKNCITREKLKKLHLSLQNIHADSQNGKKIHLYQEGDFIREGRKITEYMGPISIVDYPIYCNWEEQSLFFQRLGYRIRKLNGNGKKSNGGHIEDQVNSIIVFGNMPRWLQSELEKHDITFNLIKERGDTVDFKGVNLNA